MVAISILYFVLVTLFLSFFIDLFVEYNPDLFEQFFMRVGFGLALFSVLGVLLDLLFIPLNAWIILGVAAVFPSIYFYKNPVNKLPFSSTVKIRRKHIIYSLVLILFSVTAYMYISGSFAYPYMEDGDPWGYTAVSKVISEEETFKADYRYDHYSEPYTQGYQIVMGVLHQTNDNMYWNMKFFHNLILALSIPFFFFLARKVVPNDMYAMLSAFVLFAIPSWVTHFIFSLNYNMVLFLLLLFAFFSYKEKGWNIVGGLLLGSLIINHQFTSVIAIGILFLFFFFEFIQSGKLDKNYVDTFYIGFLTSLLFYIPTTLRHPFYYENFVEQGMGGLEMFLYPVMNNTALLAGVIGLLIGVYVAFFFQDKWKQYVEKISLKTRYVLLACFYAVLGILYFYPSRLIDVEGSASRSYDFMDFWASEPSMINNTVGIGPVLFVFLVGALLFLFTRYESLMKEQKLFIIVNVFFVLLWLVLGYDHSILIMTFRVWTFFAIFASLLAAYGLYILYNTIGVTVNKRFAVLVLLLILASITWTSFMPKYDHNTSTWPDHRIYIPESMPAYEYVREELPTDSSVVRLCGRNNIMPAFNALPPLTDPRIEPQWREGPEDTIGLHEEIYNLTPEQIHSELSERSVEYAIIGFSCVAREQEKQEKLQILLQQLLQDNQFITVFNTETEFLFQVN